MSRLEISAVVLLFMATANTVAAAAPETGLSIKATANTAGAGVTATAPGRMLLADEGITKKEIKSTAKKGGRAVGKGATQFGKGVAKGAKQVGKGAAKAGRSIKKGFRDMFK